MPCRQGADRDVLLFSWALAQDQTTDIGKDCFEGVDLGRPIAEVILAVHFVIVVREVGWGFRQSVAHHDEHSAHGRGPFPVCKPKN